MPAAVREGSLPRSPKMGHCAAAVQISLPLGCDLSASMGPGTGGLRSSVGEHRAEGGRDLSLGLVARVLTITRKKTEAVVLRDNLPEGLDWERDPGLDRFIHTGRRRSRCVTLKSAVRASRGAEVKHTFKRKLYLTYGLMPAFS